MSVAGTAVAMDFIVCSVDNDDGDDGGYDWFFFSYKGRNEEYVCEVYICKKEMPCWTNLDRNYYGMRMNE